MKKTFIFLYIASLLASCEKGWLEEKRDIALAVPTTLKDFRALLNHDMFQAEYIGMAETSSDDHYVRPSVFGYISEKERSLLTWQEAVYPNPAAPVGEWNNAYQQVLYCNIVLEGLEKITPDPSQNVLYNQLRGEALFYRARAFHNLATLFAPPYDLENAESQPGIPLRLLSDVNDATTRTQLNEVYDRVFTDLQEAAQLLPEQTSEQTHPRKSAAYALLARIYLACGYYDDALRYADTTLARHPMLIDFKSLSTDNNYPLRPFNPEVIYRSVIAPSYTSSYDGYGVIDTLLVQSYTDNDLRKQLFFSAKEDGTYDFMGNHTGDYQLFAGITTGEIVLIRAECLARIGEYTQASTALDQLLEMRHTEGFEPLQLEPAQVLPTILRERRKELLRRGIRWSDLRRLNKEPAHQTTLRRVIDGQTFELPPNDPRYTFPIPEYIIQTTGITQNNR